MWPCVLHTGLCTLRCALLGLGLPRAGLCVGGQLDYTAALCHITVVSSLCPRSQHAFCKSYYHAAHNVHNNLLMHMAHRWRFALLPFYGIGAALVAHQK
jgi:hypothetical protein